MLPGTVADIVRTVRAMELEGVIAKRKDSQYEAGERSGNWHKLKLEHQQEFVIGGDRPSGSGSVDALLVGYFEDKQLHFAAKVRAGLVPHMRGELSKRLEGMTQDRCPFINLPTESSSRWGGGVGEHDMKEVIWTRPELVVQTVCRVDNRGSAETFRFSGSTTGQRCQKCRARVVTALRTASWIEKIGQIAARC